MCYLFVTVSILCSRDDVFILLRGGLPRSPGTDTLVPSSTLVRSAAFLAGHPGWGVDPARADELPPGIVPDADGFVRTLPGMLADAGGLDGFFVVRLRAPAA